MRKESLKGESKNEGKEKWKMIGKRGRRKRRLRNVNYGRKGKGGWKIDKRNGKERMKG